MEAFLLGLSNGAVCLAYCAPVLIPCLLAGGSSMRRSTGTILQFLGGRLAGYLLFGVISWAIGRSILAGSPQRDVVVGLSCMVFSVLLVAFGFFGRFRLCGTGAVGAFVLKLAGEKAGLPSLLPVAAGLITGLNLCPPFLLAFAASVAEGGLLQSLTFFFLFFAGTTLFLVPVFLLGLLRVHPAAAIIGKFATGIMGLYYFYSGLMMLVGGIK